jgi:hypothetical protein
MASARIAARTARRLARADRDKKDAPAFVSPRWRVRTDCRDYGYALQKREIFSAREGGKQVAQKVSVTYACDLDDKEIPVGEQHSLTFGLDGQEYEIDLCAKHSERFSQVVGKFTEHARREAVRGSRRKRRTAANRQRSAEIRAWAKHSGFEVSDRGRIPTDVLNRFETKRKQS